MPYDYTDWPTLTDLKDLLTGAHVDPTDADFTLSDDALQGFLDARAELLKRETSRQFVSGSPGEVRDFDGSGNGLMYVDEYVDVTAVEFFYVPGSAFVSATNYVEVDQQPWGKEKIQILQGQPNISYGFFQKFPEGRSNIRVTATWGYGATIPADVFMAVLQAAGADALQANTMSPQGQVKSWTDGDATEAYGGGTIGEQAGWLGPQSLWATVCKNYRRSLKSHRRKSRPKLY